MKHIKIITQIALLLASGLAAQAVTITVQVDQPGPAPTHFGIFYEDINYNGDGGLYPERVKNRSFEFDDALMGWKNLDQEGASGTRTVLGDQPLNANNPHYLRISTTSEKGGAGLSNEGFFGVAVQEGEEYVFSAYGRSGDETAPPLKVEVVTPSGRKLGEGELKGFGREWKKLSCVIRATGTYAKCQLNIVLGGRGTLDMDMISLYPRNVWKQRPNGMRPDLAALLSGLKPSFMRFPGGCIVEGRYLTNRYQWKTTIGDLASRKLIINRWNTEFKHRPAPDYYQSFGLGFFEYFQLCEDIGAEPLPILNCGMACQFNSKELVPLDQLDPYVQDMLDLVEFANGPATSTWGARRAEMGHPGPFGLKMIGVGNEQWGTQYMERYDLFAKVLKQKYPDITLISSSGPSPDGADFDLAWNHLREVKADVIDEHYYQAPSWFLKNAHRYDNYDRKGPKVFAGEFAAQSVAVCSPTNRNNWECALSEAAFMTGLERNGEVVSLASYAPLMAHVEGWQWTPNLIWFDNLRSYGTPSYYVQQLFSQYRGTRLLPIHSSETPGTNEVFVSATLDEKNGEILVKLVNAQPIPREVEIRLVGAKKLASVGRAIVLTSPSLKAENSLDAPTRVAPIMRELKGLLTEGFAYTVAPYSMTVLRLPPSGK